VCPCTQLEVAALRTALLRATARMLSSQGFDLTQAFIAPKLASSLRETIALASEPASMYMLHLVPDARLRAVLANARLVASLGLSTDRYHVPAVPNAGIDHLLPFQMAGVEPTLSPVYATLVGALRVAFPASAATSVDTGPVAALLQREVAADGGRPARQGALRMLLLAALYDEFFAAGRPWPRAAVEQLLGAGGIAALLDIGPAEQRCFTAWCEPVRTDNLIEELFWGAARRESQAATLLVHLLAVVIGLPRGREHCGARIFNAGAIHDSFTIGRFRATGSIAA